MSLPVSRPAYGTQNYQEPPQSWTLIVPCLLTLPVSGWCVLITVLTGMLGCVDTCESASSMLNTVGGAEVILGAATVVTLVVGLASPASRRVLRWVIWIACVLAWLGGGWMYMWASAHP